MSNKPISINWSDGGNLKRVMFDAGVGETHLWTATVTEHPVEKGVAITDHVRPGAFRISLDLWVTNTPIDLPSGADDSFTEGAQRQTSRLDLTPGAVPLDGSARRGDPVGSATTYQWSAQFDRVRKIYDALTNLILNPPVSGITVLTTLATYDSMEIVNISVPRSASTGNNAMHFTLDMQQIRIVESQTVATPAPKVAQAHKGHKPTKEETDKPKAASMAFNIEHGSVQ